MTMKNPMALTGLQRQTLKFIKEFLREHGYPPTRADIGRQFDIWPNAAEDRLRALERKNVILIDSGTARGISIV